MMQKRKTKVWPDAFGQVVRKRRHQMSLSQEDFAEKVGIHRTYVSEIELGKVDISLTVASKIATALKTSLSSLIKEAERLI